MKCQLINGQKISAKIKKEAKEMAANMKKNKVNIKLAVVLVGDDKPSLLYIAKKGEAAKKIGIDYKTYKFSKKIQEAELIKQIKKIQTEEKLSGMIVQLPLPQNFNTSKVLNAVDEKIDVDCLGKKNKNKLKNKTASIFPPTPAAVMEILKYLKIDLSGKIITIVGAGALVGKPLALILKNTSAKKILICDKKTKNTKERCLQADILISGVGKRNLIRGNMVKSGAVVIDAGSSYYKGKIYGDAKADEIVKKASYFTPTPGGVGPITVATLLKNTVLCAQKKFKSN